MRKKTVITMVAIMLLLALQVTGCSSSTTEDKDQLGALPSVTAETSNLLETEPKTTAETSERPTVPENEELPVLEELSAYNLSMRMPEGWTIYNNTSSLIQYENKDKDGYNISLFISGLGTEQTPAQTSYIVTSIAKHYLYRQNETEYEYWEFVANDTDQPLYANGKECQVGVYRTSFFNSRENLFAEPKYARGYHYYHEGRLYILMLVAPEEFENSYALAKNIIETITLEAAPGVEMIDELNTEVYTDSLYPLSFEYPADWSIKTTLDEKRTVIRPAGSAYDPLKGVQIAVFRQSSSFTEAGRAPSQLKHEVAASVLSDGMAKAEDIAIGDGWAVNSIIATTPQGKDVRIYNTEHLIDLLRPDVAEVETGFIEMFGNMIIFNVEDKPCAINISYERGYKEAADKLKDIVLKSLVVNG